MQDQIDTFETVLHFIPQKAVGVRNHTNAYALRFAPLIKKNRPSAGQTFQTSCLLCQSFGFSLNNGSCRTRIRQKLSINLSVIPKMNKKGLNTSTNIIYPGFKKVKSECSAAHHNSMYTCKIFLAKIVKLI
jgi:hypothetical protein